MTVSATGSKAGPFSGNGVTTAWSYSFPINTTDGSDVKVYLTDPTGAISQITSNFTVDVLNSRVTYPVTGSPLATGWKLTLVRLEDLTQLVDLKNQGPFNAEVLEAAIDKVTMIVQQHEEALGRAVKYPIDQNVTSAVTDTFLSSIQSSQNAAAASQAAASASQAAAATSETNAASSATAASGSASSASTSATNAASSASAAATSATNAASSATSASGSATTATTQATNASNSASSASTSATNAAGSATSASGSASAASTSATNASTSATNAATSATNAANSATAAANSAAAAASGYALVSKTATYTATTSDRVILCDATSGAITIGTPSAVGNAGMPLLVKKTDSSSNAVTFDPNGSQTVDRRATTTLNGQDDGIMVVSDGTNWVVISRFYGNPVKSLVRATDYIQTGSPSAGLWWVPDSTFSITLQPGKYRLQLLGMLEISNTAATGQQYVARLQFGTSSTAGSGLVGNPYSAKADVWASTGNTSIPTVNYETDTIEVASATTFYVHMKFEYWSGTVQPTQFGFRSAVNSGMDPRIFAIRIS